MLAAADTAGHPVVAALLGLSAAVLALVVVGLAWYAHASQIRLAERVAARQFVVTSAAPAAGAAAEPGGAELAEEVEGVPPAPPPPPEIDGPDTVATGESARYRLREGAPGRVVSWTVGGGSVSQSYDAARPDELLLIANGPGTLQVTARVRDARAERTATKSVTAVAAAQAPGTAPAFRVRLFLQGWGLVVVAVLIVGFAGALGALGDFSSSDFVALVSPLAALLGVVAIARGGGNGGPSGAGGDATPPQA